MKKHICVKRNFEDRSVYTPAGSVSDLRTGEPIFIGMFTEPQEWRGGPSGSHVVMVATPVGEVTESVLPKFGHKNGRLIDGEGGLEHVLRVQAGGFDSADAVTGLGWTDFGSRRRRGVTPHDAAACAARPPLGKIIPLHQAAEEGGPCVYCNKPSAEWTPMQRCPGSDNPYFDGRQASSSNLFGSHNDLEVCGHEHGHGTL